MSEDDTTWYAEIAGEDESRVEALSQFESQDDFVKAQVEGLGKDWREDFSIEGDEKWDNQLQRFASPADLGKSYREAQATISAGNTSNPLPENATDEDLSIWRQENGLPSEGKGYLESLPDGLVIGDDDKPLVEGFMDTLLGVNATPEIAHAALGWYNDFQEQQTLAEAELDASNKQACDDELREQWGTEYRANSNLATAFIERNFGEKSRDAFINGRDGEGKAWMHNAELMDSMANAMRMIDPRAQVVANGGDPQKTLDEEIGQIEQLMRDDRPAYNKDEKKQARLRKLYEIREQHKAA